MNTRRHFLKSLGTSLAAAGILGLNNCSGKPKKYNVVLVLADDFGWRQLGCYGSTFYKSPHIDNLASEGMRFTDAYASCPVCSPTRAAIMTGKYPGRLHITD